MPSPLKNALRAPVKKIRTSRQRIELALRSAQPRAVGAKDLIVCSPGGVATTTLLTYLSGQMTTNHPDDQDNLKHVPRPDLLFADSAFRGRVLYIYGAPEMVVGSIERRGWTRRQAAKLGCVSTALLPKPLARARFRKAVEAQIDAFTRCRDARLMCVAFDDLWSRIPEMAAFLDLDEAAFARGFPPRRARAISSGPVAPGKAAHA